jgi:PucR family transcriptional regulator, purine catabolism regulatory protein
MPMTLRDLLAFGCTGDHDVVTADHLTDRPVSAVVAAAGVSGVASAEPGALIRVEGPGLAVDQPGFVLALRVAGDRRAAGLLVSGARGDMPAAVSALANHLDVAIVLTNVDDHSGRLVPIMNLLLTEPESSDAALIGMVTRKLHQNTADAEGMIRVLSSVLRIPVGVIDPRERVVAGWLPPQALRTDAVRGTALTGAQRVHAVGDDSLLIIQPIRFAPSSPVNLRIAALVPFLPSLARTVSQALGVAVWAFIAHMAAVSLTLDRVSGTRAALLARLLDEAEAPTTYVLESATAVGWRLGGLHTGVHIRADGGTVSRSFLSYRLEEALSSVDGTSSPVPDGDGWSFWLTEEDHEHETGTVLSLQNALLEVEKSCPGLRMRAGVGTPAEGTTGIRDSLADARLACMIALTREEPGAVERVDTRSAARLLINHYVTDTQLGSATQLLRPLLTADPAGQLLRTLSSYLDRQSSATGTALDLGIHRNTVLQRLERIRSLITVDLGDPDERLGLHLAVRLLLKEPRRPPTPTTVTEPPSPDRRALFEVSRTPGRELQRRQPGQQTGRLVGHVHDQPVEHADRPRHPVDQIRERNAG